MRDLALLTFLTLDGVMQSPGSPDEGPSGGFAHGGWARGCWDEVMEQVAQEAMREPYDLLLGRSTYNMFAASFSNPSDGQGDAITRMLNDATKYVVTSNSSGLDWNNSHRISGDIAAEVRRLKSQPGPLLQVHGSWQLAQALLSNELVDEFRLWTFPVVAGSGKRLFDRGTVAERLTLLRAKSTANGATMGIYQRA